MKLKKIFIIFLILFVSSLLMKYFQVPERIIALFPTKSYSSLTAGNSASGHLEQEILKLLADLEVKEKDVSSNFFLEAQERVIIATVPKGKPIEIIADNIQQINDKAYTISDCSLNKKENICTIKFVAKKKGREKIKLIIKRAERYLSNSSKMAILIENFNFNADESTIEYLSFPAPLTFALKPANNKSEWTAKAAAEYNKEIIITLPVETRYGTTKGIRLRVHYENEKLISIIDQFANAIPNFAGFAILKETPVIDDSKVMKTVLTSINKKHAYFVWPSKIDNSTLSKLADEIKIPTRIITGKISGKTVVSIEEELRHFIIIAQKKNNTIISSRGNLEFIKALKNIYPLFRQHGIRLVPVSLVVAQ